MKLKDELSKRWQAILAQKRDAPAIFNSRGRLVFTFRGIDERARDFESKIESFDAGSVVAIHIGNHQDWPSILIACLRREVVVLPLEQSITDQQRDAALRVCRAAGVVVAGVSAGSSTQFLPMRTSAATTHWGENPPTLLKLTSGTTAAPRAIRFRSEQLLADSDQICETMGMSDVVFTFGVIPVSHSYGFSNLFTPLISRGVPMVLSHDRT